MQRRPSGPRSGLQPGWILGRWADVGIFTGPLVLAGLLIGLAWSRGALHADMPPWMFALLIIACDVAHVYATAFRVYLDPVRFRARRGLYLGVPVFVFVGGLVLYSAGADVFWRALAYLAVWHFVRQQWGWVAYSRAQAKEGDVDRRLDQATIYAATLYPILFWHAHLPRAFHWFVDGDFAALPALVAQVGGALHWTILAAFGLRQVQHVARGRGINLAKLQIVVTTWIAWYGGIVVLDSDVAFTALNVLSHGVPYLAVVWTVERRHARSARTPFAGLFRPALVVPLLALLVLVGYVEEWLWDGFVWRDHAALFPVLPEEAAPAAALSVLVPLLALPQATHYVLDGWLWRRRAHVDLDVLFRDEAA